MSGLHLADTGTGGPALGRLRPGVCGVCARQARGFGVCQLLGDGMNGLVVPLCDQIECAVIARRTYHMSARAWTAAEQEALQTAGKNAGAYLDAIGKSDLAGLTGEEWRKFCETMIEGFSAALSDELARGEAPF